MNTCATCHKSYVGEDGLLHCDLDGKNAEISCLKYEREPGSDDESPAYRVWFCDKPGRGD